MYQLLETIKCLDGKLFNMDFHQVRFERSRKECFRTSTKLKLSENIEIPEFASKGLFRCRVTYSEKIENVEFIPYQFRKVSGLKVVEDNEIDYRFKYADRSRLNFLFGQRGDCDDIIIVKNGFITDSTFANLVLFDGERWVTPDTPLLPGTQRAKLLKENRITESRIEADDLIKFEKIGLINALNDLEEMPVVEIRYIIF